VRLLLVLTLGLLGLGNVSKVSDIVNHQGADSIQVTARSRSVQPGELVVLTITPSSHVDHVRVRAFDRDMPSFSATASSSGTPGWQALIGIDLDVKPRTYTVAIDADNGRLHTTYELIVAPKRFPTRRLTVDESFVNPPPSEQERIEREAKLLEGVWRSPAAERLWTGPFVRPVAEPANSRFGTRSVFNGVPRNPHGGADFLSPAGTPIHAPNAGRVAVARGLYFSGNTVVIDHGLGLFSMLAHMSVIDVHEGDRVAAGEVLGRVGATGRVTGPHLHWAVRAGGARVDPIALLALLGEQK
jgi:murein DD-endopeptidase MepM/ murein hydrolase activator NlpD